MNSKQFTVGDVTYEVHGKTIRDSLRIDWLYDQFIRAGYAGLKWHGAFSFVNFLVSTTVVAGDPPDFIVPPESEFPVLEAALDLWLGQPDALAVVWKETAEAVNLAGNPKELSPQADPNA